MRKLRRRASLAIFLLITAVAAGLIVYGRTTDDFEVSSLNLPAETKVVVLLFHGSDGAADPVWDEIEARFVDLLNLEANVTVVNIDWSAGADNRQRAGANAEVYGDSIGRELAGLPDLEHIRLVGHSAGAYVLEPLCEAYRSRVSDGAWLEMTFLDPFGNRDLIDIERGNRSYGKCADFAAAYINTDDFTPSTNSVLQHAYNFDITRHPGRGELGQDGHRWPLVYFSENLTSKLAQPGQRNHDLLPRGEVRVVIQ